MDYRIYAVNGLLESFSRQQVGPDRGRASAATKHPNLSPGIAQALHHQAPERTSPTRYENFRCIHLRALFPW
jgi:hypothetical protein